MLCLGLASCIPLTMCPRQSPLDAAASYEWMPARQQYYEPLNTWVRNERLEKFLLGAFRSGGVDTLKTQFGFACEPRPIMPTCSDCYVCRGHLQKQVAPQEDAPFEYHCTKRGEMLMQADIGPGRDALTVMTYWERPVSPDAGR